MQISSVAFRNGEHIPRQYARGGEDKSPPLHIAGVPPNTRSLTLTMDDPDAPGGTFTHWIVFDLDPKVVDLDEDHAPENARQGTSDWGQAQTPLSRNSDGNWKTTLALKPGRYEYRFVVDGEWMSDPNARNSVPNEFGSTNSVLAV